MLSYFFIILSLFSFTNLSFSYPYPQRNFPSGSVLRPYTETPVPIIKPTSEYKDVQILIPSNNNNHNNNNNAGDRYPVLRPLGSNSNSNNPGQTNSEKFPVLRPGSNNNNNNNPHSNRETLVLRPSISIVTKDIRDVLIDPTGCTKDYKPICASNNKTYSNLCFLKNDQANNAGIKMLKEGEC